MRSRDSQADRPTKVDPVSPFIKIHQHCQSMRSAGLAAHCSGDSLRHGQGDCTRGGRAFQTNRSVNLGYATRQGATPKYRLGA
jgi:hypothetical protein